MRDAVDDDDDDECLKVELMKTEPENVPLVIQGPLTDKMSHRTSSAASSNDRRLGLGSCTQADRY